MPLSINIAALVLLAALLHAVWNTLVKTGSDRFLMLAAVMGFGVIWGGLLALFVPPPHPASWPYLFASIVLHTGYYFFLLGAYRHGDLSHAYPLARGAAPLLVVVGAFVFAGEALTVWALTGVLIACAGILVLTFERGRPWRDDPRPVFYALGTSVWIAAYTLADGMGVRVSHSPLGFIAWLFLLDGIPIALFALWCRRGAVGAFLRSSWRVCLGGGLAAASAYGLVIYAMSRAAMGPVSALRETSVIMAALIGTLVLKESFGRTRIAAACLVAGGVAIMHLGQGSA